MRTQVIFDNVDASQNLTSSALNFEQRSGFLAQFEASGLDGEPRIILEYSIDNAGVRYDPMINPKTEEAFFTFNAEGKLAIMDDRIPAKFIRWRIEANGNTSGTILGDIGYKTYP